MGTEQLQAILNHQLSVWSGKANCTENRSECVVNRGINLIYLFIILLMYYSFILIIYYLFIYIFIYLFMVHFTVLWRAQIIQSVCSMSLNLCMLCSPTTTTIIPSYLKISIIIQDYSQCFIIISSIVLYCTVLHYNVLQKVTYNQISVWLSQLMHSIHCGISTFPY